MRPYLLRDDGTARLYEGSLQDVIEENYMVLELNLPFTEYNALVINASQGGEHNVNASVLARATINGDALLTTKFNLEYK